MSIHRHKWIEKMWYLYIIEYYSAIKKNEILPFATTWMDLKHIMPREVKSDRERQIQDVITYMWNLKNETKE